jgi:micrococcal nuclease
MQEWFKQLWMLTLSVLVIICLGWLLHLNAKAAPAPQVWQPCALIRVVDGDTFHCMLNGHDVDVRGHVFDALEKTQPLGQLAREEFDLYLQSGLIEIACSGQKHRDRQICDIRVDGKDAAEHMLEAGYACIDPRFTKEDRALEAHQAAMERAQASHIGMWGTANPVCGFDYRHSKKK